MKERKKKAHAPNKQRPEITEVSQSKISSKMKLVGWFIRGCNEINTVINSRLINLSDKTVYTLYIITNSPYKLM